MAQTLAARRRVSAVQGGGRDLVGAFFFTVLDFCMQYTSSPAAGRPTRLCQELLVWWLAFYFDSFLIPAYYPVR